MKKIFSLVVVLTMLFSAFAMTANAADIKATLVVNGDDGKAGTIFTVDYVITGTPTLYATQIAIAYDKDVVALWDVEYEAEIVAGEEAYAFTGSRIDDKMGRDTIWGQEVVEGSVEKALAEYSVSAAGSKKNATVDLTAAPYNLTADDDYAFTVITLNLVRKAEGDANIRVATSADEFYNAANPGGVIMEVTNLSGDVVDDGLVDIVNPGADEPIVEDKFINEETANGGVGTLTFYGRIGAEWKGQPYGVIIDGKDFFGANNNDTVASVDGDSSVTTFEFDMAAWNGVFEIVFTNITDKGTAGEKSYQFFVGENVTEAATVVVE